MQSPILNATYTSMTRTARYNTVIVVTIVNSGVNSLLALLKILIGFFGHSQALIADGVHSLSDLITDGLVLIAARMGDQLPDKEHPYGHRRIETIAATIISIILIVVALGIAYDTIQHMLHYATVKRPDMAVIIVAIISVLANEGLFRYTLLKGNHINSDLLRTHAWHNRSDAFVSIIVLISAGGTMLGINYLDSVGALIIAALILKMGLNMIWNNLKELIDTGVDDNTLKAITNSIQAVPGVVSIHQLRTRSHGGFIFVDVHIQVNPNISVSEGHFIGEQVHHKLIDNFDHISDVTVHVDPEDDEMYHPCVNLPNRKEVDRILEKYWKNLPGYQTIRRTALHYLNGKLYIEIYMPPLFNNKEKQTQLEKMYQYALKEFTMIAQVNIYYK